MGGSGGRGRVPSKCCALTPYPVPAWLPRSPSRSVALERFADIISDPANLGYLGNRNWRSSNSAPPVVFVTDGWSEVPSDIASMTTAERGSLTYEGRQISFILVRRSIAENAQAVAACIGNYQGVQQRNPLCGLNNTDMLLMDSAMRRTAEWAWEAGFNWMRHDANTYGSTNPTAGITAATVIHGCGRRLDLAFLLDGSGSVDMAGWNDQLNFVKAMGGRFRITETGTHIAVATFAGPRTAHFTTNESHVTTAQTFRQCQVDADCHDTYTIEAEHCNSQNQCERVDPRHCRNGEWYGNVTYPAGHNVYADGANFEVCICQAGRQCTDESLVYAGPTCLEGSLDCDSGCRHAAIADMLGGCAYNESTRQIDVSDTCELDRVFYDPDCASCGCVVNEGEGDYMWDLGHSAWTDADFNSFDNIDSLHDAIDGGLSTDCPSVYAPDFETNKPDWCYPNGATHLKFGLLHVADDLFVEERGMRSFTQGVPRVLITLSDGKANPHFEADEWAAHLKATGIRMFSIGMEDDDNYLSQLQVLASHPTDRHMFQLDGTDHLQDIVDALSWDVCETPDVIPPGIIIDTEVDAGATEFFEFPCSVNAEWVTVVVDSAAGNTQVVVATTPNPSIYDNHVSIDTSDATHKVIRFLNQGRTVYAAVQSSTTSTARFNISFYVDGVFEAYRANAAWPTTVPEVGSPIYTPTMNSSVTVPFEFTILSSGASAGYFALLDAATGAVGLTTAGHAAFAQVNAGDARDAASFEFEMYVTGTGANSSCVAGQQVVTVGRDEAPSPTWNDGNDARTIDTLRKYVGPCAPYEADLCPWPRSTTLIPAVDGTSVYTLEIDNLLSGDSVELTISSGNDAGAFGLIEAVDRRSRRQAGQSVASGSGRVDVVVLDASLLTEGQSYELTITSQFLNGVAATLPDLTVNIAELVDATMTPHFESATDLSIDLAVVESFAVNVDNPDSLNFSCRIEGSNPAGFTAARESQRCVVTVPTTAPGGETPISLRLFIDDEPCWPNADPFVVTVTVAALETESPTPSLTTPSPTTLSPTEEQGPTINIGGGDNPFGPVPTTPQGQDLDPEGDAYGNTGGEDDSTMGGGATAAIIFGILFCLLLVGLLAMWMFNSKKEEIKSEGRDTLANPTYEAAGAPPAGHNRGLPAVPSEGVYGDDNQYAAVADLSAVSVRASSLRCPATRILHRPSLMRRCKSEATFQATFHGGGGGVGAPFPRLTPPSRHPFPSLHALHFVPCCRTRCTA